MKNLHAKIGFNWTIAYISGDWWWCKRESYPPYPVLWVKESELPNNYVPKDRDFLEANK